MPIPHGAEARPRRPICDFRALIGYSRKSIVAILSYMAREFVIHQHSGYGELHYDLMLSRGEALATWRLATAPLDLQIGDETHARKRPDHRQDYLSYEGPISGGRGEVKMIDKGTYELLRELPDRWEIRFSGREIRGRWELVRTEPASDSWALRRLSED